MNLRDTSKLLYQLKLANQKMTTLFEQDTGFSITRYELMLFLRESGPCSQTVLQTQLQIDSAAVTRHLKILEEEQYVTRERNQDNQREVFVKVTEKAKSALAHCEAEHGAQANPFPLSETEERTLLALLTKLVK
ncbi:MarR family winged helix-turn-helix transcriptional regulator [Enterococcus asini]|uniref:MarR family winged helix-turn-helix transcriptional regulator n=1 Tax=Enterococcus asini TaxID=57732 RepID=UPI000E499232|nr:MarR family transcriptional regulator [Enterococcus asini]RGW12604.1 MarR family transcriptional regulator [Enterococcus asini]